MGLALAPPSVIHLAVRTERVMTVTQLKELNPSRFMPCHSLRPQTHRFRWKRDEDHVTCEGSRSFFILLRLSNNGSVLYEVWPGIYLF